VRVALGNTGSKTTIHKYLKELDEKDGGGHKASISEALQDMVERLAAQLQEDGNVRIDEVRAQSAEKERQHAEVTAALRKEIEALNGQLQRTETVAHQETAEHGRIRETLQVETIARHTAEQQVADLKERFAENDAHRQSIEEKHKHAREALEHYRQSVKEQRDQDQRRHERQVQQLQAEIRLLQQSLVVKQDEVTRLNQEDARLIADLSHVQKALYDQQSHGRQLEQKLEDLRLIEQRCKTPSFLETYFSIIKRAFVQQFISLSYTSGMTLMQPSVIHRRSAGLPWVSRSTRCCRGDDVHTR
jgi:chromosome segregation ATPase